MDITKQDKRDIEKTKLYLNEVADYISMQKDIMDGEPTWKPNVIDSCDIAVEWLDKIIKKGAK